MNDGDGQELGVCPLALVHIQYIDIFLAYYNSGGLGIMEYLNWVEAMGMESVMAVWSGYALVDGEEFLAGEIPPNDLAMYPVLQEALDQLEFCMGSIDTYWGAKRAEYGHPEPFKIKYVEIGNEE
jgi:alpha-N-arabinofuranosidase